MTLVKANGQPASMPDDLQRYLRILTGPEPEQRLLEIRFRLRGGGMGREFIPAESVARAAGPIIRRLAQVTDVYVGVALRDRRAGGRDAIGRCHLLFVEIDAPDAQQRLQDFPFAPTAMIASGGAGRRHCYWQLRGPVAAIECERANRRLAHRLGGDPVAVDASRLLRPPSSWNWKYKPRQPVRLLEFEPSRRYDLSELIDVLPNPPSRPRQERLAPIRRPQNRVDQSLLAIPAQEYVRVLTGREANRAGKVHCPFHDDRTASLQLYDDGTWYCFGACNAGGSIFDFASRVFGLETKGRAFLKLRGRLADELLPLPLVGPSHGWTP